MTRKGKQRYLNEGLDGLIKRLDRKSGGSYFQMRVAQAWDQVAGPSVAAHTTGTHLREGEMVVHVDSPIWATELSALSERYRVEVNSFLGQEAVKAVRFTVSRKVERVRALETQERETDEFYDADKVESVKLSPTELRQVEESASTIPDKELREVVIRATVADLEWKKGLARHSGRETPREAP